MQIWQELYSLIETSEKTPIVAITDQLVTLPDPLKEVAQELLPLVDGIQSLAPALGPLPVILFMACLEVGQCFTNGRGNRLFSSLLI